MVEMETAKLERGGERQMVWPTPTAVQNLQVGGHGCWGGLQICGKRGWFVGICPGQHGLVASKGLACTWYTSICIKPIVREELTDGLPFLDGGIQVVTWARMKNHWWARRH